MLCLCKLSAYFLSSLLNRHCGELIFTLSGSSGEPVSVLVTVRGGHTWCLCGDCKGTLTLWDLVSGVAVQSVAAHRAQVTAAEALWQQNGARPTDTGYVPSLVPDCMYYCDVIQHDPLPLP